MPRRKRNARKTPHGEQNVRPEVWKYIDKHPTPVGLGKQELQRRAAKE